MQSIRQRLTWLMLAGLTGLLALGGAALYPAVRAMLLEEFDYALLAKARALTTLPSPAPAGVNLQFTEQRLPEFGRAAPGAEYFQVWLRDGSVLSRSASLGDATLPQPAGMLASPRFMDVALPEGRRGRAVALGWLPEPEEAAAFSTSGGPISYSVTLSFARDRERLDRMLNWLLTGIVAGGAGLLSLLALLVRRAVKTGLGPVEALADSVTRIEPGSLGTRLPADDAPPELRPIVDQLNGLLVRLHDAFQRERRFTGNVAHELGTPIAELRSLAETALKWRGDPEATAQLAADALDIALQMQRIVEMLLALARCEAGLQEIRPEAVNVPEIIDETVRSLAARAAARDVSWNVTVTNPMTLSTDRAMLRSILCNLLDNAVEHSPPRESISCELKASSGEILLCISNYCAGFPASDLPHLFEPFWRKDAARSNRAHAGLGLALVKRFADRLGWEVRAELPQPHIFQISLRISSVSLV